MPTLLFSLRGVPDDEAYEIRQLLTENSINFYETSAGNWGISMPALWLSNDNDLEEAEKLLAEYHHFRAVSQREIYEQLKKQGKNKRLLGRLFERPFQSLIYLGAIIFIIYLYFRMLSEFGL